MKSYVKFLDNLPLIVKIILALPGLDGFFWGLYRLFKGIQKNNLVTIIVGIIWIFGGIVLLWVIDLYTLVTSNKVSFLAD
jgi:hypothetical protein